MTVEASRKEAALLHWRLFMHSEGDHLTLVNVYNAFLERMWFHLLLRLASRLLCDAPLSADNQDEAWCRTHFLLHAALRLAVAIRLELLEVMQRIELPVSPPAFGCQDNVINIKRALISGFFLNVSALLALLVLTGVNGFHGEGVETRLY